MNVPEMSTKIDLCLSPLPHLWLIDLDGTIVTHNGHLAGQDDLLPGVAAFWKNIPPGDTIVLLSARAASYREETLEWLSHKELRFDHALFGLPTGERILINDKKDSGLLTALAVNLTRDEGLNGIEVMIDANL
jgi:hypothetical protein